MKKKILILTGGAIGMEFASGYVKEHSFDSIIAVDRGLVAAEGLGLELDYVVGDYDSVPQEILQKVRARFAETGKPVIRSYQPEKDATDTEIAVTLALSLEPESIVILGGTGTRSDHSLANIQLLYQTLMREVPACLVDGHNRIYLADRSFTIRRDEAFGEYVSLLPLTGRVEGVTLTGMKYPLEEACLTLGSSLGVSNEIVADEAGISLTDGVLIVFESKD